MSFVDSSQQWWSQQRPCLLHWTKSLVQVFPKNASLEFPLQTLMMLFNMLDHIESFCLCFESEDKLTPLGVFVWFNLTNHPNCDLLVYSVSGTSTCHLLKAWIIWYYHMLSRKGEDSQNFHSLIASLYCTLLSLMFVVCWSKGLCIIINCHLQWSKRGDSRVGC